VSCTTRNETKPHQKKKVTRNGEDNNEFSGHIDLFNQGTSGRKSGLGRQKRTQTKTMAEKGDRGYGKERRKPPSLRKSMYSDSTFNKT